MKYLAILLFIFILTPTLVFARVTANDIYQESRSEFKASLAKIQNPKNRELVIQADKELIATNLKVCARFDADMAKMAAILSELKVRQNITDTIVAYGQGSTPLDQAAYIVNYAAEAVAYQKIQDYTPTINTQNPAAGIKSSQASLRADLNATQAKIVKAKQELLKTINNYEK